MIGRFLGSSHLATWNKLNSFVARCTERQAELLLEEESCTKARLTYMLRIHSRINKLRADRERLALEKIAK